MKITCIDDARSYERVLYALRSLPQGKSVRNYVDDIKRDLRAFYHRPEGCVKSSRLTMIAAGSLSL